MAKNEAKIKFTAETGEFNKAIKQANDEMSNLRAELKLNETQMKSTGVSVESLEAKHSLLERQLSASQSKTEALSQKVQKAAEIYGENSSEVTKLKTQLANAQSAEEKIRQAIANCNREIEKQAEAAEETASATTQLSDKVNNQQSELTKLKKKYADLVVEERETSDEAQQLAREINDLSSELKQSKTALTNAASAADKLDNSLDDAGEAAENTEGGFTIAGGAIADLASNAIQAAIGKISEFIGWLAELPEATRELRQSLATLDTSFERANLTSEQATQTYKDLYGILGDDGQAVEAASLIAKMSKNQEDLNKWVKISTGIFGTYGESLPIEGLAEASNETAKTGQVTGVFADALNWSGEAAKMFSKYMSEDVTTAEDAFNEALKKCSNEQERQALITDTLTKLYGGAAAEFEAASGSQIAAKEATAENALAQNELANAIEPLTTEWTNLKTQLVTSVLPAVEKISAWGVGALGWLQEHPVAMKVLGAVLGVVAAALSALIIVVTAYTVAQWAMNAAVLANPITWIIVGIVAAVAAIVAVIVLVIEYWDEIVSAVKNACGAIVSALGTAWEWIKGVFSAFAGWVNTNVIQPVVNFFKGLWDGIVNIFKSVIDWVKTNWKSIVLFLINPFAGVFNYLYENFEGFRNFINNIVSAIKNFFVDMWHGIQNVWNNICNAVQVAIMFIGSIISAAFQIITLPFRFIWENCKQYVFAAWEWIKAKVTTAINAVKTTITNVMNAIKSFFTTVWNGIKNAVSTAVNAVKNVVSAAWNYVKSITIPIFNAIKSTVTSIWNGIKNAVSTAVNAVKSAISAAWNAVRTATTTAFNAVRSTVSNIWNGIRNAVSTAVNAVKNTVSNVWNGIKSATSSAFNAVRSTASNVWNGIKTAIMTPINAAKDAVKAAIDKIKGFFSGLKLKFPNIKLPHFKITGSFSLNPPSVPKLGIEWYAKAMNNPMILNSPTIFGAAGGKLLGGGEVRGGGGEMIGGTNTIMQMIQGAVDKSMRANDIGALAAAVEDLANRPVVLSVNGRSFALATAGDSDNVNGLRNALISRGLVLD